MYTKVSSEDEYTEDVLTEVYTTDVLLFSEGKGA